MDWGMTPAMLGYSDLWRHHRRMMNNWLNARAITQFDGLQAYQARQLLTRMLEVSNEPQPFNSVKNTFFL